MKASDAIWKYKKMQEIFRLASILQLSAHMWPKTTYIPDVGHYDYIIVGGGTAGCVVASRLLEIKNVNILLVEAGGNPPLESLYPGYFQYMKHTSVDWNITSIREYTTKYHQNGVIDLTQGKMLGGTSSLNYMAYLHGDSVDYALWATIANDSSWSYEAIESLFRKNEKLIDKTILRSSRDRALLGTKGRLKIRRFYYKQNEIYLRALAELGHEIVDSINSRNPIGFTHILHTCGPKMRQSTAYSFLRLVKNNTRLHVMTNSLVTEILFDQTKTAVGVRILTQDDRIINVIAYKEVILTAGVFKTPQLLMLSGIGPKSHLEQKGIKFLVDLPVGENLQDHPTVLTVFKTGFPETLSRPLNPHTIGIPIIDGKVAVNRFKNFPDYEIRSIILNDPEMFLKFCVVSFSFTDSLCDHLVKSIADRELFVVLNHLAYPRSRGRVTLTSKHMKDQPEIKLGFYTDEKDLEMHASYLMHFNSILNTSYFKNMKAELVDPKLTACGKMEINSINYWKCYASLMVTTSNYLSGTCAMGSVLDANLFVKGVHRLRVADASIMPSSTATPTAATVIMIAEKASNMIKKMKYRP